MQPPENDSVVMQKEIKAENQYRLGTILKRNKSSYYTILLLECDSFKDLCCCLVLNHSIENAIGKRAYYTEKELKEYFTEVK